MHTKFMQEELMEVFDCTPPPVNTLDGNGAYGGVHEPKI